MSYSHIMRALCDTPLAIERKKLDQIVAFMDLRLSGGIAPESVRSEMRAARSAAPRAQISGGVAVIPILGSISHRVSIMQEASGGISVQEIQRDFRAAMAESSVSTILFDIDSPGGGVSGIPELADEIFAARSKKRIVAVANTMSASAAYWLMSAASEIVVTPSGGVGSVGVYALHMDESRALEKAGLKPTFISAGKFKVEGNSTEPLAEEARGSIQADVDAFYAMFVKAVARGRGVSVNHVLQHFGQGRMVLPQAAKAAGMVDRIATFDQALGMALSTKRRGAAALSPSLPPRAASYSASHRRLGDHKHGDPSESPQENLIRVLRRLDGDEQTNRRDAQYWQARIDEEKR